MPLPPFKPKIHVPKSSLRARGEKKNLSSLHIMSQQWPALIRWVWPQKTIPDPAVVLPVPCLSFPSISEKKSLGRGPFLLDTPQRKVPAPSLSSGQRADSEKQGEPKKSCSMDSTVRNPPRNRRFFFFFFLQELQATEGRIEARQQEAPVLRDPGQRPDRAIWR